MLFLIENANHKILKFLGQKRKIFLYNKYLKAKKEQTANIKTQFEDINLKNL